MRIGEPVKPDPVVTFPVVLVLLGLLMPLLAITGWFLAELELHQVRRGTVSTRGVGGLWFARIGGAMICLMVAAGILRVTVTW